MKKIVGILLLAMSLGLVACGDGGKDTGNTPEPTKEVAATQAPEITEAPEATATPEPTTTPEETETPVTATYKVTLTEVGAEKVKVIKAYREVTGAGLAEAKDAVDAAPGAVIKITDKTDAELIAAKFAEAGATVEITEVSENPDETEIQFVPITATYKVILTEVGPEKVKAIKLYRDLTGAGLAEAKTAVESTPCVLLETLHQSAAEQVRADFEAIGSTITVEYGMIELEEIQDAPKNYVITLLEVGPEKVKVIKAYREATGLGLKECKDAVESAPCTVIEVTRKVDAELIAATFTAVGATVEITATE